MAKLELQHSDANHALFMVLTECCNMILDTGHDDIPQGTEHVCASNIRGSGKSKMANKEIAECAYRLAVELRAWNGPRAEIVKRILKQLMLADRWEAKLRESGAFNESTLPQPDGENGAHNQQFAKMRTADAQSAYTLPPLAPKPKQTAYRLLAGVALVVALALIAFAFGYAG
ncbi:hypothetical protein ACG873_01385 (plasmid) [Mesorhizobium sp. AaZ16]|uniref:hypothetical protein n=1 Tax=Mesorhizobium sp. AaZ16 TaxID=3402289 RepID=UPI00374F2526